jgi:hypothetical protein
VRVRDAEPAPCGSTRARGLCRARDASPPCQPVSATRHRQGAAATVLQHANGCLTRRPSNAGDFRCCCKRGGAAGRTGGTRSEAAQRPWVRATQGCSTGYFGSWKLTPILPPSLALALSACKTNQNLSPTGACFVLATEWYGRTALANRRTAANVLNILATRCRMAAPGARTGHRGTDKVSDDSEDEAIRCDAIPPGPASMPPAGAAR